MLLADPFTHRITDSLSSHSLATFDAAALQFVLGLTIASQLKPCRRRGLIYQLPFAIESKTSADGQIVDKLLMPDCWISFLLIVRIRRVILFFFHIFSHPLDSQQASVGILFLLISHTVCVVNFKYATSRSQWLNFILPSSIDYNCCSMNKFHKVYMHNPGDCVCASYDITISSSFLCIYIFHIHNIEGDDIHQINKVFPLLFICMCRHCSWCLRRYTSWHDWEDEETYDESTKDVRI